MKMISMQSLQSEVLDLKNTRDVIIEDLQFDSTVQMYNICDLKFNKSNTELTLFVYNLYTVIILTKMQ